MYKVLVTGARSWTNPEPIRATLEFFVRKHGASKVLVIEGGAAGADTLAYLVARDLGCHVAEVEALWDSYHRAAGPVRNGVMLGLEPDVVVAFHWDLSQSKGTAHMVKIARKAGVRVVLVKKPMREAMLEAEAWAERVAAQAAKRKSRSRRK